MAKKIIKEKPKTRRTVRKNSQEQKLNTIMENMFRNSQLLSRSMLGSRLGVQFDGARDLYETFGYKRNLDFIDYENIYKRHGLGHRIITKYADSTWNRLPVLIDGSKRSDMLDNGASKFLKEWKPLAKRIGLVQVMRQADIMAQIGRFSLLFIGTSGEQYSEPAKKGSGIFYISAYDEGQTTIQKLIEDVKNEKFGMPEQYSVQFSSNEDGLFSPALKGGSVVHYTRVIHIAEEKLGSRVYGTPRLEAPMNRLWDLEKTTGGGAEAAWLAVWGGMLFTASEGMDLPEEGSEDARKMDEQMQKFFHRIQRYAVMKGVEVNNLGSQTVNIEQIYNTLKTDLAGTIGIPQRILFGSERGELASSQDKEEWNGTIESRRTNFAEPEILDPFISTAIMLGALPPPESGEWSVEWYPPYPMTKLEKAQYANALATGASSISGGVPETAMGVDEWRGAADLPPREEESFEENDIESENFTDQLENEEDIGKSNGKVKEKFPGLKENGRS